MEDASQFSTEKALKMKVGGYFVSLLLKGTVSHQTWCVWISDIRLVFPLWTLTVFKLFDFTVPDKYKIKVYLLLDYFLDVFETFSGTASDKVAYRGHARLWMGWGRQTNWQDPSNQLMGEEGAETEPPRKRLCFLWYFIHATSSCNVALYIHVIGLCLSASHACPYLGLFKHTILCRTKLVRRPL